MLGLESGKEKVIVMSFIYSDSCFKGIKRDGMKVICWDKMRVRDERLERRKPRGKVDVRLHRGYWT